MSKYIRRVSAPLALTIAFAVGACNKGSEKADTTLAQDSSLNRDLQLATGDSAAQPQLKDVPPPAATPEPAPTRTPTTTRPRTTPTRPATRPPTPTPEPSAPPRTASGNTVTTGEKSSGGNVGMIASGTSLTMASTSK